MFFSGNDIGIDLGTASILVFVKGRRPLSGWAFVLVFDGL